ncbi:MAG: DUF3782 domain-containing protein [Verrucomicrobia bacterium]|nr:DUF3782 domain-containing protein [Verrucomicrobiota bacterium]
MTDDDLRALVAGLAVSQKETALQIRETSRQIRETDQELKELGRQIGGLGNKFGTFTEGLMWPSLTRMLFEQFGCDTVSPATLKRRRSDGSEMEVDVLGYSNGTANRVVVVEIKSRVIERELDQFEGILRRFGEYFPEHKGKTIQGVVAAIEISAPMSEAISRRGLHLARASDESFTLADPVGFQPQTWVV